MAPNRRQAVRGRTVFRPGARRRGLSACPFLENGCISRKLVLYFNLYNYVRGDPPASNKE